MPRVQEKYRDLDALSKITAHNFAKRDLPKPTSQQMLALVVSFSLGQEQYDSVVQWKGPQSAKRARNGDSDACDSDDDDDVHDDDEDGDVLGEEVDSEEGSTDDAMGKKNSSSANSRRLDADIEIIEPSIMVCFNEVRDLARETKRALSDIVLRLNSLEAKVATLEARPCIEPRGSDSESVTSQVSRSSRRASRSTGTDPSTRTATKLSATA